MYCANTSFRPSLVKDDRIVYADMKEDDLILACQNKDEKAFGILYNKYKNFVRARLYRLSPDLMHNHESMVQDVFVKVWLSVGSLKNRLAFKTWLNRLITNLFYDTLRKRPKLTMVSLDERMTDENGEISGCREIADTRNLPDEAYDRKELMQQINAAILLLPKQFAQAVVLREFDGLDYDEIARITHSELGTVKSRIARGRAKLQAHLLELVS